VLLLLRRENALDELDVNERHVLLLFQKRAWIGPTAAA
jgi:hypothetical protein